VDPDLRLGVNAIRKLEKHSNHPTKRPTGWVRSGSFGWKAEIGAPSQMSPAFAAAFLSSWTKDLVGPRTEPIIGLFPDTLIVADRYR
jgi:hypothetical protein